MNLPPHILSADTHVIEPPNLWQDYVEPSFRDRAPKIMRVGDHDQWVADGAKFGTFGVTAQAGVRFDDPKKIRMTGTQDEVREGAYNPHAHIRDMDADGVSGDVVYPTQSLTLYNLNDPKLLSACVVAYNNWIADFCNTYPDRLKGVAILNVDDPKEAAGELRRVAKKGLRGAMIPLETTVGPRYDDRAFYEALWDAAAETRMPLVLHTAAFRGSTEVRGDAVAFCSREVRVRNALAAILLGGAFERHPGLKVGSVEFEAGWFPYFISRVDMQYLEKDAGLKLPRFKNGAKPSDFARDGIFITFMEDQFGVFARDYIGVDNLLWGSDYPHAESTYPKSREIVARIMAGASAEDCKKILHDNTARLFGFV